jgi:preprotein translocase subunit SecE
MTNKSESGEFQLDGLKWMVILATSVGAIYANSYYVAVEPLFRAFFGVLVVSVVLGVALQTEKGAWAWNLAKEARVEIRKVVWPTTQETTQTTLIVVGVVIVVALILWGLDSSLSWGVRGIIG